MSKPPRPATSTTTDRPASGLSVAIGPRVLDILDVAYRARRPVLLEGTTGIGKSQIVAQFAAQLGIETRVLDLSLLEPPDLVGLPVIEGDRTRYASPAELPTDGRGILLLEELNRAEIPVMQPALQLLSARRLHGYELPVGWSCVASINPEDGDYQVHSLDPAMRSRFLQVSVHADVESWLGWAQHGNVHPSVLALVTAHDDAFGGAPPRSWAYASEVLHALRAEEARDENLLHALLRGYLPAAWAQMLVTTLVRGADTLAIDVGAFLGPGGGAALATTVKDLQRTKRDDAVTMIASRLRRSLAQGTALTLVDLEERLGALPGDHRDQCLESAVTSSSARSLLEGLGAHADGVASGYPDSGLQRDLLQWRERGVLHRVRLVVAAMRAWLDEPEHPREREMRAREAREALLAIARDAGPLGAELERRVRAAEGAERER